MVHIAGLGRVGKLAGAVDILGILLKEKRRLLVRVMAHLDGMVGKVAPDAIDPADREEPPVGGRNEGALGLVDDEFGGFDIACMLHGRLLG